MRIESKLLTVFSNMNERLAFLSKKGDYRQSNTITKLGINWTFHEGFLRPDNIVNNKIVLLKVHELLDDQNNVLSQTIVGKRRWIYVISSHDRVIYTGVVVFTQSNFITTWLNKRVPANKDLVVGS